MRADAQRNLDRVIDAACECFAAGGVDVSVDEVARRAGVGHGDRLPPLPDEGGACSTPSSARRSTGCCCSPRVGSPSPTPGEGVQPDSSVAAAGGLRAQSRAGRVEGTLPRALRRCPLLQAAADELVRRAQSAGALSARHDRRGPIFELVPRSEPVPRRDPRRASAASRAWSGCGQRPAPSSAGSSSSSRSKTSAIAAAACGRTSSTVTAPPGLARDRREHRVLETARRDPLRERRRIEVDVERVAVRRHPARDVDADRRDLPRRRREARRRSVRRCARPRVRTRASVWISASSRLRTYCFTSRPCRFRSRIG